MRRPRLGGAWDKRLDAATLAGLSPVEQPFDPAQDFDLVDELLAEVDERVTAGLESLPAPGPDVTKFPVLVATLQGTDGAATAATLGGFGFVQVPLTVVTDTASAWRASDGRYIVPTTGIYRCEGKMRIKDGTYSAMSYGLGIGTAAQDAPSFFWSTSNGNREGIINQRVSMFNAGDAVLLYAYFDHSGSVSLASAELTIDRMR